VSSSLTAVCAVTISFRIDNSLTWHATEPSKTQGPQAEANFGRKCLIMVCKAEELLITEAAAWSSHR
jgi:hypothetical protein